MIRVPRWRHNAPVVGITRALTLSLSPPRARQFASTPSSSAPNRDGDTTTWPLLKRKGRAAASEDPVYDYMEASMGNRRRDTPQKPYSPFDNIALVPGALRSPDSLAPRGWADDPESHTLRVSGLGTNVKSSDFDRLFSKERSRWHWMNFEVRQRRDPDTLEPLGCYEIVFPSGDIAQAYLEKLQEAHRHARDRAALRHPQEQTRSPFSTLSPDVAAKTESNVGDFTLAPGTQSQLWARTSRSTGQEDGATTRVESLVKALGYPMHSPVIILDVYPPTLTEEHIAGLIRADARSRGYRWGASRPLALGTNGNSKDISRVEKLRGRFVLAFNDGAEARRFHRAWNRRTSNGAGVKEDEDYLLKTSLIES